MAFGGACLITSYLTYFDVILGPPAGLMRLILWPVDFLLWATGPGAPMGGSGDLGHEWTPVQDLAVWVGAGLSWAVWVMVGWVIWSRAHQRTRTLQQRSH